MVLFKFVPDEHSTTLEQSCTIFNFVENKAKSLTDIIFNVSTPDDWRFDILQKLILLINNGIRKMVNSMDDVESRICDANNELIKNLSFCNVLLYNIGYEEESDFKLTSLIDKSEWESLTVDNKWILIGYALVNPLSIPRHAGIEMFEIFLKGHNLGEFFYNQLLHKCCYDNLWICNPRISALKYWIKRGLFGDIIEYFSKRTDISNTDGGPLKDNEDALCFLMDNLRWDETCIQHIIRMDDLYWSIDYEDENVDDSWVSDIDIIPYEYLINTFNGLTPDVDFNKERQDFLVTLTRLYIESPQYFNLCHLTEPKNIDVSESKLQEYILAKEWLKQLKIMKFINNESSSYGLKHVASDWHGKYNTEWIRKIWNNTDDYISNVMMILAMYSMGYVNNHNFIGLKHQNCYTHVSSRSLIFMRSLMHQ